MIENSTMIQVWRRQGAQALAERERWSAEETAARLVPVVRRPLRLNEVARCVRDLGPEGWWRDPTQPASQALWHQALMLEAMTPEAHNGVRQQVVHDLSTSKYATRSVSTCQDLDVLVGFGQRMRPGRAAPFESDFLRVAGQIATKIVDPRIKATVGSLHLAAHFEETCAAFNLEAIERRDVARYSAVLEEGRDMRVLPTMWRLVEQEAYAPEERLLASTRQSWDELVTKVGVRKTPAAFLQRIEAAQDATSITDPVIGEVSGRLLHWRMGKEEAPLERVFVASWDMARTQRAMIVERHKDRARADAR